MQSQRSTRRSCDMDKLIYHGSQMVHKWFCILCIAVAGSSPVGTSPQSPMAAKLLTGNRVCGRQKSRLQHVTAASPSMLPSSALSHGMPDQATPGIHAHHVHQSVAAASEAGQTPPASVGGRLAEPFMSSAGAGQGFGTPLANPGGTPGVSLNFCAGK